jgi:hypothetical protein
MSDQPKLIPATTAFLTAEHVENWKAERASFVDQQNKLKEQLAVIQQKIAQCATEIAQREQMLRQAIPFVPDLADWFESMDPEAIALTDAIKRALHMHRGQALNREIIKQLLPRVGYAVAKLNANPNYFYTALKRLVIRNEIMEAPPGHFRLK